MTESTPVIKQEDTPKEVVQSEHENEEGPKIEGDAKFSAVDVATGEEGEETIWKRRAKLFRFDKDSNGWKERGTGEIKFLQNKVTSKIRVLMRRDGTLKICANHLVLPTMDLKPNIGSDRSWVWSVAGDMSDEVPNDEIFAIRFQSAEVANEFKKHFEESQAKMKEMSV
jgi:Ran-binding protein 1